MVTTSDQNPLQKIRRGIYTTVYTVGAILFVILLFVWIKMSSTKTQTDSGITIPTPQTSATRTPNTSANCDGVPRTVKLQAGEKLYIPQGRYCVIHAKVLKGTFEAGGDDGPLPEQKPGATNTLRDNKRIVWMKLVGESEGEIIWFPCVSHAHNGLSCS